MNFPPSKISALSSAEFVVMVADDPDCKIDLKTFHCELLNDHENSQHIVRISNRTFETPTSELNRMDLSPVSKLF
jgi:hypothetical protein